MEYAVCFGLSKECCEGSKRWRRGMPPELQILLEGILLALRQAQLQPLYLLGLHLAKCLHCEEDVSVALMLSNRDSAADYVVERCGLTDGLTSKLWLPAPPSSRSSSR